MPASVLRATVTALAKAATLARIPVITSASVPQGPNGPLIPDVHQFAPHATYITRRGELRAWDSAEFVAAVMESWRAAGGEPDVAPALVGALAREGFRLRSVRPLVFAARPGGRTWQWPASFVETNAERLLGLGRVSPDWAAEVVAELKAAEADPASVRVTPLVLEVIAERL